MKYTSRFSVIVIVCFSLFFFFSEPSAAFSDFQRTKIAVLDFELIGDKIETMGMGAIISEWFITSIVKTGRFEVVERALLQKILEEQKLSITGVVDQSSASQIGKVLGVKAIITGSVLKLKNTVEINSRVIDVESCSIIAAESIRGDSGSDLRSSIEQLTAKIITNFPLTGYIVKKTSKVAIIDLGLNSGLTIGTEFLVYKEGDVIKHPRTGEVLDVAGVTTGRLRITKISNNIAEGSIINEESGGIKYGHQVKSLISPKEISKPTGEQKNIPNTLLMASLTEQESASNIVKGKDVKKIKNEKKKIKSAKSVVMDIYDKNQIIEILEFKCSGEYTHWLNPITGNLFNVLPKPAFPYKKNSLLPCRKIEISANSPAGISESKTMTYCRSKSGKWRVKR